MNKKIKKELELFKEFKKSYNFTQKEFIQKDDNLYCDGELLQQGDEKVFSETEKWINVGYKLKGPLSKTLSNLFPYEFVFRGKKMKSIEGFFQGIKFENIKMQNMVFEYSGLDATNIKIACNRNIENAKTIYWQGKAVDRFSEEYDNLVDELYISAIQNPLYRNVLKNVTKPVVHSIGKIEKSETVFTRYEFEYMLNCLIAFLKEIE